LKLENLVTEMVPIDSVTPYENNPRKNGRAIAAVAASIREFGFLQPIVVDADRVVIVGHTRLDGAKQLGLKEVPIHVASNLTPDQVKAYRIADNASGQIAEWDQDFLKLELEELRGTSFNLAHTGYALADIDLMLAPLNTDEAVFDTIETPRVREGRKPLPPDPEAMAIGGYEVRITNAEFKRAFARVEAHVEKNGLIHGFVSSLLGIELVEVAR
jgi:hypothetical protein